MCHLAWGERERERERERESCAGERWFSLLPWQSWFQSQHTCPISPSHSVLLLYSLYLLWAGLGRGEGSGALTFILTCIVLMHIMPWWRCYLIYVILQRPLSPEPSDNTLYIRLTKANSTNTYSHIARLLTGSDRLYYLFWPVRKE